MRNRGQAAFGLAVLSLLFAIGGLVWGYLTLLSVVAAVGSTTIAVRALRRGSAGSTKTLARVAIGLAIFTVLALVWVIVFFTISPPE